jgi:F0F1-type ATP synthase assembly protein I
MFNISIMNDEKLTESEKEDLEFEQDKHDGFYQTDKNAESDSETQRKGLLAYGALATLIAAIIVFIGIGWAIDYKFQTAPWGIVGGILFGAIIGFYQFIKISSKLN